MGGGGGLNKRTFYFSITLPYNFDTYEPNKEKYETFFCNFLKIHYGMTNCKVIGAVEGSLTVVGSGEKTSESDTDTFDTYDVNQEIESDVSQIISSGTVGYITYTESGDIDGTGIDIDDPSAVNGVMMNGLGENSVGIDPNIENDEHTVFYTTGLDNPFIIGNVSKQVSEGAYTPNTHDDETVENVFANEKSSRIEVSDSFEQFKDSNIKSLNISLVNGEIDVSADSTLTNNELLESMRFIANKIDLGDNVLKSNGSGDTKYTFTFTSDDSEIRIGENVASKTTDDKGKIEISMNFKSDSTLTKEQIQEWISDNFVQNFGESRESTLNVNGGNASELNGEKINYQTKDSGTGTATFIVNEYPNGTDSNSVKTTFPF